MHPTKALSLVLLPLAFGCGGKVMDIPASGYAPISEDGSVIAEGDGGVTSSSGSSGAGSSGSSGGVSSSSSGGSSSGGPTTCGGEVCDLKTQVCCVSTGMTGDAAAGGQKCTATAACTGLALACADKTDCPTSEVCCFTLSLGGGLGGGGLGGAGAGGVGGTSSCKTSCGTGLTSFQLCSSDSECPTGKPCQSTGYGGSVCGGLGALGGLVGGGTAGSGGLLGGGTAGGGLLGGG